ncbi:hypothetical protein BG006_006970 [Podila minutissima]|uniref:sn-1-specific diacylglycerol lipase n=1 Tax=Podila minutissima TaxID=64525 RepID=A0A9P5SKE2_9FUNG|nr:hypothetical protein BG006_006970 [Podila minutissima]
MLEQARHFVRLAIASYGSLPWVYFGYSFKVAPLNFIRFNSDRKNVIDYFQLKKEDMVVWHFDKRTALVPSYYIIRDPKYNTLCIIIRGTFSITDAMTDLVCEYYPYKGGLVHKGIMDNARFVLERSGKDIEAAIKKFNLRSIYCLGHSLGAGSASLLCSLLQDHFANYIIPATSRTKQQRLEIRAQLFAPPPVCTPDLAEAWETTQTAFINEDDIICRLSYGNALDLKELIKVAAHASVDPAYDGLSARDKTEQILRVVAQAQKDNCEEQDIPRLVVGGKIIYLHKTSEATPVIPREVSLEKGGGGVPERNARLSHSKRKEIRLEYSDRAHFAAIPLRANWLWHHFPQQYDSRVERALAWAKGHQAKQPKPANMDDKQKMMLKHQQEQRELDEHPLPQLPFNPQADFYPSTSSTDPRSSSALKSVNAAPSAPSPFGPAFAAPHNLPHVDSPTPSSPSSFSSSSSSREIEKAAKAQSKLARSESKAIAREVKHQAKEVEKELRHQAKRLSKELKHQVKEAVKTLKNSMSSSSSYSSSSSHCDQGSCSSSRSMPSKHSKPSIPSIPSAHKGSSTSSSPVVHQEYLDAQLAYSQQCAQKQQQYAQDKKSYRQAKHEYRDQKRQLRQAHRAERRQRRPPLVLLPTRIVGKVVRSMSQSAHHSQQQQQSRVTVAPPPLAQPYNPQLYPRRLEHPQHSQSPQYPTPQGYMPPNSPLNAPPNAQGNKTIAAQDPMLVYSVGNMSLNPLASSFSAPRPATLTPTPSAPPMATTSRPDLVQEEEEDNSVPPPPYEATESRR